MNRKKMAGYLLLTGVIILASLLFPYVIDEISGMVVDRILMETEAGETETEETADTVSIQVTMEGTDKAAPGSVTTQNSSKTLQTEAVDTEADDMKQLEQYRHKTRPVISESVPGSSDIFISDRQETFTDAVADYIYSLYGDILKITRIDIVEMIKDDDTDLSCQIEIYAARGKEEYSELFISTYNKEQDFYSIYPYNNVG